MQNSPLTVCKSSGIELLVHRSSLKDSDILGWSQATEICVTILTLTSFSFKASKLECIIYIY